MNYLEMYRLWHSDGMREKLSLGESIHEEIAGWVLKTYAIVQREGRVYGTLSQTLYAVVT